MSYDLYSAIGNGVRVKLLLCLRRKAKSVTELIETCGLSQSAVSQHLAKLKSAGLVTTDRSGKQIRYSLKYKKAAYVCKSLLELEKEVR